MYTAPQRMAQEDLDSRVPLSIAQWHAHVNLCMPPKGKRQHGDWTRFGLRGTIATEQECRTAGGRFFPQIYGWMLHVYPYEIAPEKIWTPLMFPCRKWWIDASFSPHCGSSATT